MNPLTGGPRAPGRAPHPAKVWPRPSTAPHAATIVQPKLPHAAKPERTPALGGGRTAQRMEMRSKEEVLRIYSAAMSPLDPPTWPTLKKLGIHEDVKRLWVRLPDFKKALKGTEEYADAESKLKERESREKLRREEQEAALEEKWAKTRPRRRRESLARLLETPENVCVALVQTTAGFLAATNRGLIAKIKYDTDTLYVEQVTAKPEWNERSRHRDAHRLATYIGDDVTAGLVNGVKQVAMGLGDNVHAEMKLLDYCASTLGWKNVAVRLYISKLCCQHCYSAFQAWNSVAPRDLKFNVIELGTHSNSYPGWTPPPCIKENEEVTQALQDDLGFRTWSELALAPARIGEPSTRRSRSPSPERRGNVREYVD